MHFAKKKDTLVKNNKKMLIEFNAILLCHASPYMTLSLSYFFCIQKRGTEKITKKIERTNIFSANCRKKCKIHNIQWELPLPLKDRLS